MCGATTERLSLEGVDVAKEAVIQGTVSSAGQPVPGAFVRLLDSSGEFTAEVVTSATGAFRFFAAPGSWTVRALSVIGAAQSTVTAERGAVAETTIDLP